MGLGFFGKHHTKKAKERMSVAHLGKHLSKAAKEKISKAQSGSNNSMFGCKGKDSPMFGRHHTEKARKEISKANSGKIVTLKTKEKISKAQSGCNNSMFGKVHTEDTLRKMSKAKSGKNHPMFGRHHTSIARRKIGKAAKKRMTKNWKDSSFAKRVLSSSAVRPNGEEKEFQSLLNFFVPKTFKYFGDGSRIIGGKNPDFVRVDGKKKQVIEFWGYYWHKGEWRKKRVDHFVKYGYDCLIVKRIELKNPELLGWKILEFADVV